MRNGNRAQSVGVDSPMPRTPAPKRSPTPHNLPQSSQWKRKLSRPISITEGPPGRLVTLDDARLYILLNFERATKNLALSHAIELLIRAAETGKRADREAATAQMELVLRAQQWL